MVHKEKCTLHSSLYRILSCTVVTQAVSVAPSLPPSVCTSWNSHLFSGPARGIYSF